MIQTIKQPKRSVFTNFCSAIRNNKRKVFEAVTVTALFSIVALVGSAVPVSAQSNTKNIICQSIGTSIGREECLNTDDDAVQGLAQRITNVLTFFIGAISVIVIVIAGFMYVLSGGSPDKTKRAREAILYAVIGIAVAAVANLIVRFVLSSV